MCKIFKNIFKKNRSIVLNEMFVSLKDLYIGQLGYITSQNDKYYWNKLPINNFIAFQNISTTNAAHSYQTYGIDIFTNSEFYFFHCHDYLSELVGKIAINNNYPIAILVTEEEKKTGWISKERVQEIVYNLNNPDKINKKELEETSVSDPILKAIIKTSNKIKDTNILEEDKKYLANMLRELGKYYASELISIKTKNYDISVSLNDLEYTLKMDVVSKLNLIEAEINKALVTGNISREYLDFDEELKRNLALN